MPPHRRYSVSPTPTTHTRSRTGAQHRPRPRGLSTATAACEERLVEIPSRQELEAVAQRAGALALARFRGVTAERKADRTLVTAADREVERLLVDALVARFPDVGVLGEEGTVREGRGATRVVIDPIDGTAAFVAGLPLWAVCIGVLHGAEPVAGVVHLPAIGETYSAGDGVAWWNGQRLPPARAPRAGGAAASAPPP